MLKKLFYTTVEIYILSLYIYHEMLVLLWQAYFINYWGVLYLSYVMNPVKYIYISDIARINDNRIYVFFILYIVFVAY